MPPASARKPVTLSTLDERLERIERIMAPLEDLPLLAGTVGDIADEQAAKLGDVDERMQRLAALIERITRPKTLAAAEQAVDLIESLPDLMATVGDIVDSGMESAASQGVETHKLAESTTGLMISLLRAAPKVRRLLDSKMLDERTIDVLEKVGNAIADAGKEEPPRVGLFGAMRAMGNAHLKRTIGFALKVGSGLGAELERNHKQLKG